MRTDACFDAAETPVISGFLVERPRGHANSLCRGGVPFAFAGRVRTPKAAGSYYPFVIALKLIRIVASIAPWVFE